jgi:hypothetical protein
MGKGQGTYLQLLDEQPNHNHRSINQLKFYPAFSPPLARELFFYFPLLEKRTLRKKQKSPSSLALLKIV